MVDYQFYPVIMSGIVSFVYSIIFFWYLSPLFNTISNMFLQTLQNMSNQIQMDQNTMSDSQYFPTIFLRFKSSKNITTYEPIDSKSGAKVFFPRKCIALYQWCVYGILIIIIVLMVNGRYGIIQSVLRSYLCG